MKLAVICSAGGASVFQSYDFAEGNGLLTADDILLITDRECGAEVAAQNRGITAKRITFEGKSKFSANAYACARDFGASAILMAYSRLVGPELFEHIPTLNIHPSLLPAFPGIGAVAAARKTEVGVLGASLHFVDESIDNGPMVAQAWMSAPPPMADLEDWNRASFVLKAYLAALVFEQISAGCIPGQTKRLITRETANASLALSNSGMVHDFSGFLKNRGVENFIP